MPRITLYLNDGIHALVERAALAEGLSKSRWIADTIRKHARLGWPSHCVELAGAFADFPLREDPQSSASGDVLRVGF